MTQLPYRTSGNLKKPVEYSFTTESTRRDFSYQPEISKNYRYVHFLFEEILLCSALLPADGFILAFSEVRTQV